MLGFLREERYAGEMRSPTAGLPFPYWRLSGRLRSFAAKCVYLPRRLRRDRQDPGWPIAPAADVLLELVGESPRIAWRDRGWGLSITHDVDTLLGLRRCPAIADVVERAGFRSCFYVVGEVAECEPGIVRELRDRGHEIGSHDVRHDNRICELPEREMDERLKRARGLVERYGGTGFRSPSLIRSPGSTAPAPLSPPRSATMLRRPISQLQCRGIAVRLPVP